MIVLINNCSRIKDLAESQTSFLEDENLITSDEDELLRECVFQLAVCELTSISFILFCVFVVTSTFLFLFCNCDENRRKLMKLLKNTRMLVP